MADDTVLSQPGEEVEKAMADALDGVQKTLALPTKDSSKKASSLNYSVTASIDVSLDTQWEIMSGFILQQVRFRANVQKTKGQTSQVGVHLSATMSLQDAGTLFVSGNIPRLQQDRDIQFILNIRITSMLQPVPASSLLSVCALTDKNHGQDVSKAGDSLLNTTSDLEDDSIAMGATLVVVRSHKTNRYYIKSFEIALGVQFQWDIVPDKIQLRQVDAELKFARRKEEDPFDGYIALGGLAKLGKSFDTRIQGLLLCDQNRMTLALSCDVGPSMNRNPGQFLGMLAGEDVANKAGSLECGPPDLSYPSDGSCAFSVFAVFEKPREGSWRLNEARTALLANFSWKPVPELHIYQLRLAIAATRPTLEPKDYFKSPILTEARDKLIPRNRLPVVSAGASGAAAGAAGASGAGDDLVYAGYICGKMTLGGTQVIVSGSYQQDTGVFSVRCDLGRRDLTSLTAVASDPTFSSLHGGAPYGEKELQADLDGSHLPESCPLKPELVSYSGYGSDRHLLLRLEGTQFQQLTFAAKFPLKWTLIDGLELAELGLWFDIRRELEPTPKTLFKAFAYGSFLVADTVIFAFVAASTEVDRRDFLVRLSASSDPDAQSQLKPATVLEDSRFGMIDVPHSGDKWTLPSSLKDKPSPLEALNSASADLTLAFTQTPKEGAGQEKTITYDISLEYAHASMVLDGNWQIFPEFSLHNLKMGLLIKKKKKNGKQSDSSHRPLVAELNGIFDVSAGSGARKVEVTATFMKDGDNKSFTARLTTYSGTSDGQNQQMLDFSPNELLSIPALGGRTLSNSELASADGIPANFPVQQGDFLSTVAIECEILVTESQQTGNEKEGWSLSRIQLWVKATKTVEIIQGSLTLLDARLALTISNMANAQRTIKFTAETTIQIGTVIVKAALTFAKNEKVKILAFTVSISSQDMASAVKQLTGQKIEDLLPDGAPGVGEQGSTLKLGILCSSVSQGPDESFSLDALDIYFQADQSWRLDPFAVTKLEANIGWKETAGKRKRLLKIFGEITCNSVPVRVQLSYSTVTQDTVTFSVDTLRSQKLLASDLATIPKLGAPTPDAAPADCPDFTSLAATRISGTFRLQMDVTPKSWSLWSLDIFIESSESIPLLQISNDISLFLERIGLEWQYRADPRTPSTRTVYGFLALESGANRADIRLLYSKTPTGETYTGEYEAGNTGRTVDHKAVLQRFLPKKTVDIPEELQVPESVPMFRFTATLIKGKSIMISAGGRVGWKIPFEKLDITLEEVGLDLYVQLGSPEKLGNTYNVCLTAGLALDQLKTANNIRVKLGIEADGGQNKAVLIAQLIKSTESTNDIERLSEELDAEKWTDIIPAGSQNISSFTSTAPLFVYIDFISRKMLLTGNLPNSGSGLFFTSKKAANGKRDYLMSVSTPSLGQVFGWVDNNVGADFDLSPVEVSVMAYDGTVVDLLADLRECTTLNRVLVPIIPAPATPPPPAMPAESMLAQLPPTMTLNKGAWFFAGIRLSGSNDGQQMSTTLSDCVDSTSAPTIWISGSAAEDTFRFDIAVNNFVVLGGALRINGIGSYERQTRTDGQQASSSVVTVSGTVELLQLAAKEQQRPTLSISFTTRKDVTTFTASASPGAGPAKIESPLGGMFNVSLELISLSGHVMRASGQRQTQFSIKGKATFSRDGGNLAFDAEVVFSSGGVPTLVIGGLPPSMSITGIFSRIVKPDAPQSTTPGSWPDTYPDFSLRDARLWYAKQDIDYQGNKYVSGYQAEAVIEVFGNDFKVAIKLPSDRSGVTISSTLISPIDLGFMKFLNPTLMVQSKGPVFSLASDLQFFEVDAPSINISYQSENSKPVYRGSLKLKDQKDPLIKIICRDGAWGIESWNLPDQGKFLGEKGLGKLQDAIMDASNHPIEGCDCDALVDLVFDEVITTKFSFQIVAPEEPGRKLFETIDGVQKLNCTIKTSFDVLIVTKPLITAIGIGNFPLSISGPFALSRLDEALVNTILNLFADIGKAILEKPEDFAKITTYIAAEKLTPKLVKTLLCRKAKSDNVVKKGKEQVEEGQESAENSTNDAIDKVQDAIKALEEVVGGAAGAVGGAIGALGVAGGLLEGAAGVLAGLFGAAGALGSLLMGSLSSDDQKKLQARRDALDEALVKARSQAAQARGRVEQSLTLIGPPELTLKTSEGFADTEVISVNWSGVLPETIKQSAAVPQLQNVAWEVSIKSITPGESFTRIIESKAMSSWTISTFKFTTAGVITAQVRAIVRDSNQTFNAPFSTPAKLTYYPRAPQPQSFAFSEVDSHSQKMDVVFSSVALGNRYEILIGPLGETSVDQHIVRRLVLTDDAFLKGGSSLVIPLAKVPDPDVNIPLGLTALEARTRIYFQEQQPLRNSIWSQATNSLNVLKPVGFRDFAAKRISGAAASVLLEWQQDSLAEIAKIDFELVVFKDQNSTVDDSCTQSNATFEGNHRSVTLNFGSSSLPKDKIYIAVRQLTGIPIPKTISLFHIETVSVPDVLIITGHGKEDADDLAPYAAQDEHGNIVRYDITAPAIQLRNLPLYIPCSTKTPVMVQITCNNLEIHTSQPTSAGRDVLIVFRVANGDALTPESQAPELDGRPGNSGCAGGCVRLSFAGNLVIYRGAVALFDSTKGKAMNDFNGFQLQYRGGAGSNGQNGGPGKPGIAGSRGTRATAGGKGGRGGDAGAAGSISDSEVVSRDVLPSLFLVVNSSQFGAGGRPGKGGVGGVGGKGAAYEDDDGSWVSMPNGPRGANGADGQAFDRSTAPFQKALVKYTTLTTNQEIEAVLAAIARR